MKINESHFFTPCHGMGQISEVLQILSLLYKYTRTMKLLCNLDSIYLCKFDFVTVNCTF